MTILTRIAAFSAVFAFLATTAFGQEAKKENWEGTLKIPGMPLRLQVQLTTKGKETSGYLISKDQNNAKLKLDAVIKSKTELTFKVPRVGASYEGKLSKDQKEATGTFRQNGGEFPLKLKLSDGTSKEKEKKEEKLLEAWVGNLDLGGMKPVMQFRIVEVKKGKKAAYFDSVTEGRTGFKATWSKEKGKLTFGVKSINLTYEGELNEAGDEAKGTWAQGGREFPLTLKKKASSKKTKTWRDRPQNPKGPFPYKSEDVVFENKKANIKLAGTLTIPKKAGRHPAVVLISGSGPQDRDETLMGHKPFLVLADYLSRRGIAVLRYDDRGCFKSTGKFSEATTQDFATDVSAAVDFLRTHKDIDSKKIGLAGHSEGGLIAPITAGSRDDLAFIVLMAGTGVDGAAILRSQSRAMLEANGVDQKEVEVASKMTKAAIEVILAADPKKEELLDDIKAALDKIIQTLPEEEQKKQQKELDANLPILVKRLQGKWMRYFLKYDPRPALKKVKCPTMAIIGSKDLQVLPKLNMPEIEKALKEGGAPVVTMVEIPNLNHLFQECKTGSVSEYALIDQTFSPVALKHIGDWIVKQTK